MTTDRATLSEAGARRVDEPRAARTLRLLTDALLSLLQRESLTELTVTQVCREAGVHRTTFYGHYSDVDALAADVFVRIIDGLTAVEVPTEALDAPPEVTATYLTSMADLLQHVAEERTTYRALFASPVGSGFRRSLTARLRERADLAIGVLQSSGTATEIDRDTAAAFVSGGITASIEAWAESDETDATARAASVTAQMPSWWPVPAAR